MNLALKIGGEHGYPYTVAALIWQESSFCARTHHLDGSHGCGGIRLQTAEYAEGRIISVAELERPESNISIEADYFSLCIKRTPNWRTAVYAYHWGIPKSTRVSQEEVNADGYVKSVAAKVRVLEQLPKDTQ